VITVSLIGGLGNQMFQYAAGKALAERHRVPLALDVSGFRAIEPRNTPRSFLLDRLRVPEAEQLRGSGERGDRPADRFVRSLWKQRIDRVLGLAGLPRLASSTSDYREPHFHYDPAFERLGPATSLFGYFQSERYFGSIAESLRDCFAPSEALGAHSAEMLGRIEASDLPVSVHVRRGDYLKPGTMAVHGILGGPYYRAAINRIESTLDGNADYFVFSDDAAAAEQMLDFLPKSRFNHVRGDAAHPWEDMTLMSRCRHHVIANSSFSWWGAWLNSSPEKVVIAPRAWFTQPELRLRDTCDLYPPDWVQL
jgi:glycosyl transferase family 11